MKYISALIILLTLICHLQFYSQSNFKKHRRYEKLKKMYTLNAEELKAVQKDGKTNWSVKTTLTNNSHDTLFFFSRCVPADFSVDTTALFIDFPKCEGGNPTVIAVKPKGQYIVNLEITSIIPLTSSMSYRIVMFFNRAKKLTDNITDEELMKTWPQVVVFSNQLKM